MTTEIKSLKYPFEFAESKLLCNAIVYNEGQGMALVCVTNDEAKIPGFVTLQQVSLNVMDTVTQTNGVFDDPSNGDDATAAELEDQDAAQDAEAESPEEETVEVNPQPAPAPEPKRMFAGLGPKIG